MNCGIYSVEFGSAKSTATGYFPQSYVHVFTQEDIAMRQNLQSRWLLLEAHGRKAVNWGYQPRKSVSQTIFEAGLSSVIETPSTVAVLRPRKYHWNEPENWTSIHWRQAHRAGVRVQLFSKMKRNWQLMSIALWTIRIDWLCSYVFHQPSDGRIRCSEFINQKVSHTVC